jgi:hypothetical protein
MVVVMISEHSSAASRVTASGASTRTAFKARTEDFVAGETNTRFLEDISPPFTLSEISSTNLMRVVPGSDGRTLIKAPSNLAFVIAMASIVRLVYKSGNIRNKDYHTIIFIYFIINEIKD